MSEINFDWDKRNQPLTEEELARIRELQKKYHITDEEWNREVPEHKRVPVREDVDIDTAAARAGGYVAHPEYMDENDERMRKFSAVRQYSLRTGKPIAQLTEEDYDNIFSD